MASKVAGVQSRTKSNKRAKQAQKVSGVDFTRNAASRENEVGHERDELKNFWDGVAQSSIHKGERWEHWGKMDSEREGGDNMNTMQHDTVQDNRTPREAGLIDPSSTYKIVWDLFLGILIFYSIIQVPLEVAFDEMFQFEGFVILDWIITALFFVDIFFTCFTAIINKVTEELILDQRVIMTEYAKFWLWIDLASAMPFEQIYRAAVGESNVASKNDDADDNETGNDLAKMRLIKSLRLMRLIKLVRAVKLGKLETYIQELHINPVLTDVVKLILQIFVVAHIVACLWYSVSGYDVDQETPSWINPDPSDQEFEDSGVTDRYVVSFYWTITTMLSIGYGDFSAVNSSEYIFSIIVMILGGISFGAVIAQVTRLIETRNPQAKAFKIKMDELKSYLEEKTLPDNIKIEAKEAYTYYFSKKSSLAETGLLEDVPKHMLNKLVSHIYSKEKEAVQLFRTYDENFVVALLLRSKPFQAKVGDAIYLSGDIADEVHFIVRGSVRFSLHDGVNDVVCGYVREGGFFGDFEYLKHTTRICDHYAAHDSSLLSVGMDVLDMASESNVEEGVRFMLEVRRRYETFHRVRTNSQNRAILLVEDDVVLPQSIVDATKRLRKDVSRKAVHEYRKMLRDVGAVVVREKIWVDGHEQKATVRLDLGKDADQRDSVKQVRVLFVDEFNVKHLAELYPYQIERRGLIYHKTERKYWWDGIVGILILYSTMSIPVMIGFSVEASTGIYVWELVVDFLFMLDIYLCMSTTYRDSDDEAVVIDHKMIREHYYRTWFTVDFLSGFPFDLVVDAFQSQATEVSLTRLLKTLRLVRLLKLARVVKLVKYMNALEDQTGISPHAFDLIKLTIEVAFIGHMIACLWWYFSISIGGDSWWDAHRDKWRTIYKDNDLEFDNDPGLSDKYLLVFYWTITTLSTVGYGDISPSNTPERIFSIFIMIIGASVFGYIVANVSTLMSNLNEASARVSEKVSEVSEYLYEKQCPEPLSLAIVKHLKHLFSMESSFDEQEILSRLPAKLRGKLLMIQHMATMKKIAIFRFIERDSVLIYLFEKMRAYYFSAEENIVHIGQPSTEIMFISAGNCDVIKMVPISTKNTNKRVEHVPRVKRSALSPHLMENLNLSTRAKPKAIKQRRISMKSRLYTFIDRFSVLGKAFSAIKNRNNPKHSKGIGMNQRKSTRNSRIGRTIPRTTVRKAGMNAGSTKKMASVGPVYHLQGLYDEAIVGHLSAGDFFGHTGLINSFVYDRGDAHRATVRAHNLVSVYGLSKFAIPGIIRNQPSVALSLQIALGAAIESRSVALRQDAAARKRHGFLNEIHEQFIAKKTMKVQAVNHDIEELKHDSNAGNVRGRGLAKQSSLLAAPAKSTAYFSEQGGALATSDTPVSVRRRTRVSSLMNSPVLANLRDALTSKNQYLEEEAKNKAILTAFARTQALARWRMLRTTIRKAISDANLAHALEVRRHSHLESEQAEESNHDDTDAHHHHVPRHHKAKIPKYLLRAAIRNALNMRLSFLYEDSDDYTSTWVKSNLRTNVSSKISELARGHFSSPNLGELLRLSKLKDVRAQNEAIERPKGVGSSRKGGSSGSDSGSDSDSESASDADFIANKLYRRRQSFPSMDNKVWMAEYGTLFE